MKKNSIIIFLLFSSVMWAGAQTEKPEGVDTVITLEGKEVYISYPADFKGKRNVIMAVHGSGREALSYDPRSPGSLPFYVHQRDLAVGNGFMFVVISNGRDTWGTDEGLKRLEALYRYIYQKYPVKKKWCLWATSAGGVLLARFIRDNPEKVSKAIGTFPVYDLRYEYSHLKSAYKAWETDSALIDKVNPIRYPRAFKNIPYLVFHGKDDSVVPLQMNSLRLKKEVDSKGGQVMLHVVPGGHNTNNWNVYNDKVIIDFLMNQ